MDLEKGPVRLLLTVMAKPWTVGHHPRLHPLRPAPRARPVAVLCLLAAFCSLSAGGNDLNSPLALTSKEWVYLVGSNVTVNCTLEGAAAVNLSAQDVLWSRDDGVALTEGARVRVLGPSTSQLSLMDVQFSDSGTYRCSLGREDSHLSAYHRIDVGLTPSKPTNVECWSNTFSTVICNWTEGRVTNLDTTYQLLEQVWLSPFVYIVCQGNTCNRSGTDLGLFQYMVNATNALGIAQSPKKPFSVMSEGVPNPPVILKVEALSKSSLEVTWGPPLDLNPDMRSRMDYEAQWGLEDSPTDDSATHEVDFEINSAYQRFIIANLTRPYAVYEVRMRAKSDMSKTFSGWSMPGIGRTHATAPDPGHKLDLDCRPLNDTRKHSIRDVQLSWAAFPEEKANGELQYIINVSGTVYSVAPNISVYVIQDLDTNKIYHISIHALNSMGTSTESTCTVKPIIRKSPSVSALISSIVAFFAICLVLACCYKWVKKSTLDIPDIRVPRPDQTGNLTLGRNRCHPLNQEAESFDNVMETGLSVDLSPEVDTCPACCKDSLSRKPILGLLDHASSSPRKPTRFGGQLAAGEKHQERVTEQEALLSPYAEARGKACYYPCLQGNWMDSTLSIGSGGSYMNLRDEREASYGDTPGRVAGPTANGDCRRSLDGLGGGREVATAATDGWGLAELASLDDSAGLLPSSPGRSAPVLNGDKEEDWLPMGSYKGENGGGDYMNMGDGDRPGQECKEKTWTVNHCTDVPSVYPEPHAKWQQTSCADYPEKKAPPGEFVAPCTEGAEIANYVQQSFSPPASQPRPGCESPRPGWDKVDKPPSPKEAAAKLPDRAVTGSGDCSPARKTAGSESGPGMDPELSDVSDKPASVGCPCEARPTPDGVDDIAVNCDLASDPPTPEERDWCKPQGPASGGVDRPLDPPLANADNPYVTISQLPMIANSGSDDRSCSDYVSHDQLLPLMGTSSPASARTHCRPREGDDADAEEHGEVPPLEATTGLNPMDPAEVLVTKAAVLNGHYVPSPASPPMAPQDNGYVTQDDLARMAAGVPEPTDSKPQCLTHTAAVM